ncbi:MAG: F0F1 ATP synthase subunit delta [Terriglobales bacterium]|jgi:F-type H+-transporting ATPase subunit delta
MKTTKQIEREAKHLFSFCVVGGNLDESRIRLVARSVLESKHRGYLSLLGRFKRLLEHEYAQRRAVIESAVILPTNLRTRVQTGLTAVYGPGLTWLFTENPSLIGGIRIKIGSDVYDGSVRSSLAALARSFEITSTNGRHAKS